MDLHNFQDVLMLESLRVNRAMVLDAFIGVAEVCASRPGMLANDRWDERDEDGHWQEYGLPVIGPCNYRPVITAVITVIKKPFFPRLDPRLPPPPWSAERG